MLKALFSLFCRGFFRWYCPVTVIGAENLPQEATLFCANHCSHMDTAALAHASNHTRRDIAFLAAKDYFFKKGKRTFSSRIMHLIPIERKASRHSLENLIDCCKRFLIKESAHPYKALVIYPEGTRSIDGNLQEFKEGASLIAHALQLPITPVFITGSMQCLPKGKYFPAPGRLTVMFGEPIHIKDIKNLHEAIEQRDACAQTTREVEAAVHHLRHLYLNKNNIS